MAQTQTTTEQQTVICVGATIPSTFLEILKSIERPAIEGVKWVEPENLFVAFQNFYKKRPGLDNRTLTPTLRDKIYYEFFPMMLRSRGLEFAPSASKPNSLKLNFDIASSKDTRMNVTTQMERMTESMRNVLKNTSVSVQSFECDPKLTIAHISPKALSNPALQEIVNIELPEAIRETFYLDKLCLVEVNKTEAGLIYDFFAVE